MQASDPHFLLFSTALASSDGTYRWRFVLQPAGGDPCLAVADAEEGARPSRLELLSVVRGLEALEQPSRITLVTRSRYVIRGIRRGLAQWRERSFRWECFGQLVPIRDDDLWQRVDRAMQFHQIECREWRDDGDPGIGWSVNHQRDDAGDRGRSATACHLAVTRESLEFGAIIEEPALVIVPRASGRRATRAGTAPWPWLAAFARLRQAVLTPLAAIRRPAFTRAA
jgi:ribonuclease HI